MITNKQIQLIMVNLPITHRNDKDLRADFLRDFTNGRISSTKELSCAEANELIASLTGNYIELARYDWNNKQHRLILSLCYELGWTCANLKKGGVTADLNRLGQWLISERSPIPKPLRDMTPKETSTIINALQSMVGKKYR